MAPEEHILKDKIKILDTEIKQLKDKLNAMEWERKKYLQFCNNEPGPINPSSAT